MANLNMVWLIARGSAHRRRTSLLAFAAAAAIFHALVAASFPAIGGVAVVESVISTFPTGLRALLKLAPNLQVGFGLRDYLAFSWFHPVFLGLGAALVVSRAADALAGEIENGAIYLLLSRPLPRAAFVAGKALEMAWSAVLFSLAAWLGLVFGVWLGGLPDLPLARYLLVAGFACLLFFALGAAVLVISSLMGRSAAAAGWGTALVLTLFILDVVPAIFNSPVANLNPWHHYFPQEMIYTGRAPVLGALILVGWTIGGASLAAVLFTRRDLV